MGLPVPVVEEAGFVECVYLVGHGGAVRVVESPDKDREIVIVIVIKVH